MATENVCSLHDGAFRVRKEADGTLVHLTGHGRVIGVPEPPVLDLINGPPLATASPVALDGAPCQFTYAVDVLTEACARSRSPDNHLTTI